MVAMRVQLSFHKVWRRSYSASPGCFAHKSVIFKVFWKIKFRFYLTVSLKRAAAAALKSFCRWILSSGAFYFTCKLISKGYQEACVLWLLSEDLCPALCKQMFEGGALEQVRVTASSLELTQWRWRVDVLLEARRRRQPITGHRRFDSTHAE